MMIPFKSIYSFLLAGLLILSASCAEDKIQSETDKSSKIIIEKVIDKSDEETKTVTENKVSESSNNETNKLPDSPIKEEEEDEDPDC